MRALKCLLWSSSMFAALAAGCGGTDRPPPEPLASCLAAGWQPLTAARRYPPPLDLHHYQGELFYTAQDETSANDQGQIEALPVAGGAPRVVVPEEALFTWLEGSDLFFSQRQSLMKVPTAGGAASLVVQGPVGISSIFDYELTANDLVWRQIGDPASDELWAVSRAGGAPRLVDDFDKGLRISGLQASGGDVIVVSGPQAVVVPLAGGANRPLATGAYRFAGAGPEGVYSIATVTPVDLDFKRSEIYVSPVDGSPRRRLWADMPPRLEPQSVWSDGAGGWLVAADRTFDDGLDHEVIYLLDADQRPTLAACDPSPTARDYIDVRPAFAPDAVYVVTKDLSPERILWQILKVPRPSTAAR